MITVGELLKGKGGNIWHVGPNDTVFDAIKQMNDKRVGALAVVEDDKLVGIISERDYTRKVILHDRSSKQTPVKAIMTREVTHVIPQQPLSECLVLINERRIRHLPVLDNGKLVGMISVGDVVKEIIKEQQYTIEQLESNLSWAEAY